MQEQFPVPSSLEVAQESFLGNCSMRYSRQLHPALFYLSPSLGLYLPNPISRAHRPWRSHWNRSRRFSVLPPSLEVAQIKHIVVINYLPTS